MSATDGVPIEGPVSLASFKGAELTLIQIWRHGVLLRFDDEDRTITIEGQAEIKSDGQIAIHRPQDGVALGTLILGVLNRKVVAIEYDASTKRLTLMFDGNIELTLRPDSSGYESYQIYLPDGSMLIG